MRRSESQCSNRHGNQTRRSGRAADKWRTENALTAQRFLRRDVLGHQEGSLRRAGLEAARHCRTRFFEALRGARDVSAETSKQPVGCNGKTGKRASTLLAGKAGAWRVAHDGRVARTIRAPLLIRRLLDKGGLQEVFVGHRRRNALESGHFDAPGVRSWPGA